MAKTYQNFGFSARVSRAVVAGPANGRIGWVLPNFRNQAAQPACAGQRDGDPGRIRTCDPQIRNLMLYPAELRGRSAGRPNFAVRSNPARLQASRKLDQRPSHRNAESVGAAELLLGGPFIAPHYKTGFGRCRNRPVSAHPESSCRVTVPDDMPKPLLIERNRDRDLVMLAMVEMGCISQFDALNDCIDQRFAPRPERMMT